jgi:hypothetical protein
MPMPEKLLDSLDIDIEEYVKVAGLPVGYMQFTEIAREIDKTNIKMMVFDEPTAVLAESEASNLLSAMQKIAAGALPSCLSPTVWTKSWRWRTISPYCGTAAWWPPGAGRKPVSTNWQN